MDNRIRELNQTMVEVEAPEYVYPDENFQGKRAEIKPVDEAADIQLSKEELLKRYSEIQDITIEEAQEQVGGDTEEEILKNIQEKTIEKINGIKVPLNRAQRRALKKKVGSKKYNEMVSNTGDVVSAVSETAKKLNYIDLIQKLRKLNEEKENNGEATTENN